MAMNCSTTRQRIRVWLVLALRPQAIAILFLTDQMNVCFWHKADIPIETANVR
jgi:hypothetical protein